MSGPNSYLSEPAPEYAELLKVMNPLPDLASLGATIEEARKNFVSFTNPSRSVGHIPTIGLAVKEFKILTRDGYSLPVRSYIPEPQDSLGEDKNTTWPALVWGHHGGWIFGGLDSDDTTCRVLATSLRIAVLNVEFRKSPEYVFPSAVNDMHDSVRWVAANPEKLQAGLTKGFIIAGVSAGANMAAVVAHLARDEKLSPPLTGQLLSQGTYFSRKHLDFVPKEFHAEYTSDIDNKDAAIINSKSAEFIFKYLKPDASSPLFCPVLWDSHKGLPRAYIEVTGCDPLRDEGLIYSKILARDGVETKTKIFPGLPHAFYEFGQWNVAKEWVPSLLEGGRFLLGRK